MLKLVGECGIGTRFYVVSKRIPTKDALISNRIKMSIYFGKSQRYHYGEAPLMGHFHMCAIQEDAMKNLESLLGYVGPKCMISV